jgi:pimeloyl-[acyl-carrier protein] synthase
MLGKGNDAWTKYDLRTPEATVDPYPIYARMLSEAPVHWSQGMGGWVVARYDDVTGFLRDPRLSANRFAPLAKLLPERTRLRMAPVLETASRWTALLDPPEHTRLRGMTQKGFSPRVLAALRPRIQKLTDELLDGVQTRNQTGRTMDLIADFALPLPAMVIAELLGAEAEDFPRFTAWSDVIVKLFSVSEFTDEFIDALNRPFLEMREYLHGIIEDRRQVRRHDLISHLLDVQEQDASLSDQEMEAECILLLMAGHETTVNLIGTSTLALLRNPAEAQKLREDPSLMPKAVEEFLRYDGTVKWMTRMALEDIEIREARIEAGDLVVLLVGAANRDPIQFRDPDRLDVTRAEGRQLGFGHGVHVCEGAQLARMEMEIAMTTLLRRMPDLHLAVPVDALDWNSGSHLRSLKALPVTF